jgi:glycosyltransferase involved in cell wall biosynthesis
MNGKLSITIPVFNEEKNIEILYQSLLSVLEREGYDFEIIFVNDGSKDKSWEEIKRVAKLDARVKGIRFTRNFGQTSAMMAGFEAATGEIIIPMDADLQNDPEDIPKLLEKIEEGFDVCSGWRNHRKDARIRRTLVSKVANGIISTISGVKLRDYGCTLKAYHKDVVKGVKLYGEMHRFIPIYASWEGAKIAEIPVRHQPRIHGKSSYGLERTFKVILDLVVITFLDNYAQKPIYVFGGFGFVSFLVSFAFFTYACYLKLFEGITLIQTPLPLISTMTFVTGVICVLMGLLAEMIMRTYYESQQKKVYLIDDTVNIDYGA